MRPIAVLGLICATAIGTGLCAASRAADLGPMVPAAPIYSEPDTQFEFGTGWYLRGDASFEPADHPVLTGSDFNFNKHDWDWAAGGGIGYKFNSFLRADLTGDYIAPVSAKASLTGGGVTTASRIDLQRYDGLANLYVDLGSWYGVSPYVGAGVGFRVFDPSSRVVVTDNAAGTSTVVRTHPGSDAKFAWAAMAGVSIQIDPNIAVDVGYRHLDLGRFSATLAGYTIDRSFSEDQVRIGVRYMID